jgi:hypothetical protein
MEILRKTLGIEVQCSGKSDDRLAGLTALVIAGGMLLLLVGTGVSAYELLQL